VNESSSPAAPGPATIDDVAREAGVSTATVSRALRDHPYVAEATRTKVREAAARLRYVANPNAARLASGTANTVALLAPVLTSWYTAEVVAGVEDVLAEHGYDLLIATADPADRDRLLAGETRFRQRVDGLLLVDVMCREEGAARLAHLDLPIVVLGEELHAVTSVSVDNVVGAAMAAEHLVHLGHRRIAMIGGTSYAVNARDVPTDRSAGFRAALAAAGLPLRADFVVDGGFSIEGGRRAAFALMAVHDQPTAIFAMSDEMAFGVLQALRELGLTPGHDMSVIGFDDHTVSAAMGLSTVRQPVRAIGRTGALALLEHLEGVAAVTHHPMPLQLVQRASTGAPQ
jgi:DNA-binding LacI/PurR family transcriptional regulator